MAAFYHLTHCQPKRFARQLAPNERFECWQGRIRSGNVLFPKKVSGTKLLISVISTM
jgi:hypothetical protein